MAHRVLVIGWDGAEPRIVEKLLAEGKLPNLAALIATGAYTRIRSTVRPESSVAWTTFATGVEPGEHGVFGFTRQIPGSYQTELVSTRCVRQPFFWETLGQQGKRVAILNMPMAYPPRPVNGWLVCGLMTPDDRSQFTYPATLGPELLGRGYVIDADPITVDERESRRDYLQRMTDQVRERTRLALSLLGELDWDLGMVIFTELDRLQHFYWADHNPYHPRRPEDPFVGAITDHYVELDQALGRLAAVAGSEASVIVMSDHGFGPCARQFLVNNWLIQAGWLALKGDLQHMALPGRSLAQFARRIPLARQVKRRFFGKRSLINRAERRMFLNMVDWSRTRAWYTDVGGVRLNVRGREPEGLVSPGAEYRQLAERSPPNSST